MRSTEAVPPEDLRAPRQPGAPAIAHHRRFRRWFAAATPLCAALAVLAAPAQAQPTATAAPGACGALRVAAFQWAAARVASEALAHLLRRGYGCDVTVAPASPARALAAMVAPGARDRAPLIAPAVAAGRPAPPGARRTDALFQGEAGVAFHAPSWLRDAHPGVTTLQAASRQAEAVFRLPGGGRARMFLCPAAWRCHDDARRVAAALGLERRFDIVTPETGAALIDQVAAEDRALRPWIATLPRPSAFAAERGLTPLSTARLEVCPEDAADGPGSGCRAPFAETRPGVVFPERLALSNPRVTALLARFEIPTTLMANVLRWRAERQASDAEAGRRLVDSAPQLAERWLDAPARAAFAAGRDAAE
ncbi:MAG: glycine betaine ABC transporter substrate-binding protein [Pseudomonadota bacterium]